VGAESKEWLILTVVESVGWCGVKDESEKENKSKSQKRRGPGWGPKEPFIFL
jgi:hypothetical protein